MAYASAPPAYSQGPHADPGVIVAPNVPYIGPLSPVSDGYMITINGRVLPKADRFHVNLSLGNALNEQCENALHINPRFAEKIVIRNSFLGRSWVKEERGGPGFPLQKDENFEMIILVTDACYKIAFNGKHFCEFAHRTPKDRVTSLVIEGDLMIHNIKITDPRRPQMQPTPSGYAPAPPVHSPPMPVPPMSQGYPPPPQGAAPGLPQAPVFSHGYPPPHPQVSPYGYPPPPAGTVAGPTMGGMSAQPYPVGKVAPPHSACVLPPRPPVQQSVAVRQRASIAVPHTQALPRGVGPGTVIRIHGRPKLNPQELRFDFLCNNQDIIAFHFNPRFRHQVVVRNTKSGSWGREERQQPKFPFIPGKEFDMIIYSDPNKYQVTIDGENFTTYNHRIRNLANIRFLQISGDLELYSLQI